MSYGAKHPLSRGGRGDRLAFQRANLITNLKDKDKQRQLLDLLFNTTTGAGFTMLRNGIGSSLDSSSDHMNTFAPKNPGGPTAKPNYQFDGKDSGQLWVSQEAYKTYGVRVFYADSWSAPGAFLAVRMGEGSLLMLRLR